MNIHQARAGIDAIGRLSVDPTLPSRLATAGLDRATVAAATEAVAAGQHAIQAQARADAACASDDRQACQRARAQARAARAQARAARVTAEQAAIRARVTLDHTHTGLHEAITAAGGTPHVADLPWYES